MIREGSNAPALHRSLGGGPMILEGFVVFEREASVDRGAQPGGRDRRLRPVRERARAPYPRAHPCAGARRAGRRGGGQGARGRASWTALDYVGVLAVELFVARDGRRRRAAVVNELAPRVHNSGHWTIEGAQTSQFEQHIRAIAGWPLGGDGAARPHRDAQSDRRRGRRMARHPRPARPLPAPLRQAGDAPGAQDGPCDAGACRTRANDG